VKLETQLVHAGEPKPRVGRAVTLPVFQSATYEYAPGGADGEVDHHQIRYARLNNTPNHEALHAKLAALEGAEDALVTASGMAAVSAALLAVLKPGDHLLVQEGCYGTTYGFAVQELRELGIETDFVDGGRPEQWEKLARPRTRAIWVEAMTNPLLRLPDYEAVIRFARGRGILSMIDATFASPVNFRPLTAGFDLVMHSATKYLNGHSDIVAGALAGSREVIGRVKRRLDHLGGSLDPHACFLLQRGLKTLALRVRHQNESTLRIARVLSSHPAIAEVVYPGLESHPDHARARRFLGGFGGVLSFRPRGGVEAAVRLIERVKLPAHAPSLGGVETLITRPAVSTHAVLGPEARARAGITDDLLRLAVGIEAAEDLLEDLSGALQG
jgi:cystathionine beta-lyase/cystathionine gamma-synthase